MEAKDTVMNDKAIMPILNRLRPAGIFHVRSLGRDFKRDVFPLLEAQAEISFKAGQKTGGDYMTGYDDGARWGLRAVVEWMKKHSDTLSSKTTYSQLQAKLKSWGID